MSPIHVNKRLPTGGSLPEAPPAGAPLSARRNVTRHTPAVFRYASRVAVALALVAGCDVREPLAPVPAPGPDQVPRALVDPVGEFSSTGFLNVPGTSTQSAGSVGPTPIGGAIPRDMWVRVRTSGTVSYTINPDARDIPCGMQCVDHAPRFGEGEAGGAGIPGKFALRTYLTFSGGYEPSPRNLGNQLAWVIRVKAGAVLRARRSGIPGGPSCPACDPPAPYVGWYLLSGGTVVTVEEVIPLQAAPRQLEVVRGDSVTFDAVAIDGTTNLRWYFGDIGGAARVSACDGKTTCTVAPRRNGFMYIYGDYDGQSIFSARSETVRLVNAKLTLACSPNPVTRGEEMTCTATRDPSTAQVSNVRWNFVDSAGHNIPGPTNDRLTWGGIMVVGGTMSVSAEINGARVNANPVTVEVSPRTDWLVAFPAMPEPERSAELPYPPVLVAGGTIGEGVFGKHRFPQRVSSATVGAGTGPNQNWYYMRIPVEIARAHILINPGLYPDDPFFRAQRGGRDQDGYRRCDAGFMRSAKAFVEAHERRHHEIAAEFYADAGSKMLESAVVYAPPTEDVLEVADTLLVPVDARLKGLQAAFDSTSKLQVTCKLQPVR